MNIFNLKEVNLEETAIPAGYEINIEQNPDHWRGGYVWSVSIEDEEVASGLEFSRRSAYQEAEQVLQTLMHRP
ncbi:hypothetical protein RF679_00470 [Undibacterium cyanobacteriorum]|uniref:Uncharacterized protein n=1 Tax=Undibacterium cyanobacteriorum TaxID=3073561 RepID=A0ABY9RHR8_9BURK|nr:hypothetical protein [Undibacterium sp. 20NA77.5]WMW80768.1 hypothetical protein RF679_00470 [Undibacterium sp. 20NA77.5]